MQSIKDNLQEMSVNRIGELVVNVSEILPQITDDETKLNWFSIIDILQDIFQQMDFDDESQCEIFFKSLK